MARISRCTGVKELVSVELDKAALCECEIKLSGKKTIRDRGQSRQRAIKVRENLLIEKQIRGRG